jgi:hypothetical protein
VLRMFEEITDTARVRPLRRAIAFLTREKFNSNTTYIATTVAGEARGPADAALNNGRTRPFSRDPAAITCASSV